VQCHNNYTTKPPSLLQLVIVDYDFSLSTVRKGIWSCMHVWNNLVDDVSVMWSFDLQAMDSQWMAGSSLNALKDLLTVPADESDSDDDFKV